MAMTLFLIIIGLQVLNVAQRLESMTPQVANPVRGILHGLMGAALVLGIFVGWRHRPLFSRISAGPALAIVAGLAATVVLGVVSHPGLESVLRGGLALLLVVNLLILYPMMASRLRDPIELIRRMSCWYLWYAYALIVIAVYFQLTGQAPALRLGYPIANHVFGYQMLIAWLIVLTIVRQPISVVVFPIAAILAGSRANLLFFVLALAYMLLVRRMNYRRLGLVLAPLVIIVVGGLFIVDDSRLHPYFQDREEVTSGRLEIWRSGLDMLRETSWVTGVGPGSSVKVGPSLTTRGIQPHNAFLEASMEWGVPFALIIYAVWLWWFFPWRQRDARWMPLWYLQLGLFTLISLRSIVAVRSFWTDPMESATLLASMILLCPSTVVRPARAPSRRRVATDPRPSHEGVPAQRRPERRLVCPSYQRASVPSRQ